MTIRRLSCGIAAGLLACGLVAIAPAKGSAQVREGTASGPAFLPEQGGPITLYGCFLRMKVADEGTKFVLVNPTPGPATSVPEATCTSKGTEQMVELDDVHTNLHKHHLDRSKVGRWIEVTGRLEKTGHQALREVHVNTYRIVPVVAPRAAEAAPVPTPETIQPAPAPAAPLEARPTATTGVTEELPHTASSLPLIALLGFLALAGGLALRLISYRQMLSRG